MRLEDDYDDYTASKIIASYNLSQDKIETIKEPFLRRYVKNQKRYISASQ
jgi:hypothetical protein